MPSFLSHTTVIFTDHFTFPLPFKHHYMLVLIHSCSHYRKMHSKNLAGSSDKMLVHLCDAQGTNHCKIYPSSDTETQKAKQNSL